MRREKETGPLYSIFLFFTHIYLSLVLLCHSLTFLPRLEPSLSQGNQLERERKAKERTRKSERQPETAREKIRERRRESRETPRKNRGERTRARGSKSGRPISFLRNQNTWVTLEDV